MLKFDKNSINTINAPTCFQDEIHLGSEDIHYYEMLQNQNNNSIIREIKTACYDFNTSQQSVLQEK